MPDPPNLAGRAYKSLSKSLCGECPVTDGIKLCLTQSFNIYSNE